MCRGRLSPAEERQLQAALEEAGVEARAQLEEERDRLVAVAGAEAVALVAAFEEQRRKAAAGNAGARAFLDRAAGHPISQAGGTMTAASAIAARHREQAVVQLVLSASSRRRCGRRRG